MSDDSTQYADDSAARLAERRAQEAAAVSEAGGGESEGFELAEEELIEHASHGDQHSTGPITRDSSRSPEPDPEIAGEADEENVED
jgi:hypothetical protein